MLKNANSRYYPPRFIVACNPLKNGCCQFSLHSACSFDPTNTANGKAPGEQTRPPTILYQEVSMLETRVTFVKFSYFLAGLSFLFDLLAVESHILSAYSISARMYIATLTSLSVVISLFLYEISRSPEALSLHIADVL